MSSQAKQEYEAMRNAIQANIDAIRALIQQAEQLSQTITQVEDHTLKNTLTQQVESLNESINHLVEETDKLFKQYIELANSVVVVSS